PVVGARAVGAAGAAGGAGLLGAAGGAAGAAVLAPALVDRAPGGAHIAARTIARSSGRIARLEGLPTRSVARRFRVRLPVGHGVSSPQRRSSRRSRGRSS